MHTSCSGIPEGSVLGPILFVLYINDLPDGISSNISLFADDTKIYNRVNNEEDSKEGGGAGGQIISDLCICLLSILILMNRGGGILVRFVLNL